jgi:dynactin-6
MMRPAGGSMVAKPKTQNLTIWASTKLEGNIHFGEGCIVHPSATISAEGGDIIFGDYCIIEELVVIKNVPRKDKEGNLVKRAMKVGNYNIFECGAQVSTTDIGDLNEFGVKC